MDGGRMNQTQKEWLQGDTGRILVVDDEVSIGRLVARILQERGYTVVQAASGEEALARLAETPFELVVTDLRMPGMDGLTLSAQCQAKYPDMRLIILTAHGTIQSAVQAIKQGIDEYLVKPFRIEDLVAKVANCLDGRRHRPTRRDALLRPLIELNRILSQTTSLTQTVERIVGLLAQTFAPVSSIEMVMFGATPDGDLILAHQGPPPERLGWSRPTRAEMDALASSETPWLVSRAPAQPSVVRLASPLLGGGQVAGVISVVREDGELDQADADAQLLQVFAYQIGLSILQSQTRQRLVETFQDLEQATVSTVESLFAALETYDPPTHHHSERVARYAYGLGRELGLSSAYLETLRIAALLHDIGKIGVGEGTIRKNGSLDDSERERIMMHPEIGERILSGIEAFRQVTPLVLYHHERYDGQGYPAQLAGEDIPLGARIIAVVDTFDSLTSDRSYRVAVSDGEALHAVRAAAGAQFDPRLVDVWCSLWPHLNERAEAASGR
jgi:putative nucleotidyltransferase with HDIG domain